MTDNTNSATPAIQPAPRRRWRTPLLVTGALAVGLTAGAAGSVVAAGGPFGHFGPGMGPGMGPGWGHGMRGQMDPAQVDQMIERGVKHFSIEIDATADQQTKLIAIAQGAAKDLRPLREQLQAAHAKGRALLVQPTLDGAAIEAFRSEQMGIVDQASKRIAQAVTDVAGVLTPAQRAKIGDRLDDFGGFRGGWHRG